MINLLHLLAFHAVAEERNMSRGAERLMVSQPAVSVQVAALERSLGVKLFHRLPRGVKLTSEGEALASYARRIFALQREAEEAMDEMKGVRRGTVTVGASTTIGVHLLPELIVRFRRAHPGVEVRVRMESHREIVAGLMAHKLEIGLMESQPAAVELQARVFDEDELVAIVPPGHRLATKRRVTAKMLCEEELVVRDAGAGVPSARTIRSAPFIGGTPARAYQSGLRYLRKMCGL